MTIQPLTKPSRLDRDVAKFNRRVEQATTKRQETRKQQAAWLALSDKVRHRDGNQCRVCTCQTTRWGVGNPVFWGSAHHLVYRSAGGPDELSNLVWLCRTCHTAEHQHQLVLTGTAAQLRVEWTR